MKLVEAIDQEILKGDILGAFEKFAADDCVTFSSEADKTTTKAQKMDALQWFFSNIANVNAVNRVAVAIDGNVSRSQFVFDFTNHQGENLVYREVIRRVWEGDKMVEEQYLMEEVIEKPVAKKKTATSKSSSGKKVPGASKTVATDDLTLIEGVGPKIAEILNKGGINNFSDLAAAKPAAIKAMLESAGSRYKMHDPTTWPQQAKLARDGKMDELQKLQGDLKAGRK